MEALAGVINFILNLSDDIQGWEDQMQGNIRNWAT